MLARTSYWDSISRAQSFWEEVAVGQCVCVWGGGGGGGGGGWVGGGGVQDWLLLTFWGTSGVAGPMQPQGAKALAQVPHWRQQGGTKGGSL